MTPDATPDTTPDRTAKMTVMRPWTHPRQCNQPIRRTLVRRETSDTTSLLAPASVLAYKGAWNTFLDWCAGDITPLPATPEVICQYLEDAAQQRRLATLTKHLSAIAHYHDKAGHDSPTTAPSVRRTMKLLRREYGVAQEAKAPILIDDIRKICPLLPDTLSGKRDKCLLLLGYAGAFRRSELVALEVRDLELTERGLLIVLRRSKTDQEGQGRDVGIPYGKNPQTCPVLATRGWLECAGITEGALLRSVDRHGKLSESALSDKSVGEIVKRLVAMIGLDAERYGGHSLRAGLATTAALEGATYESIKLQTGHKSREMVDRYIRAANLWRDNAASWTGL